MESVNPAKSLEEEDHLTRSKKKMKGTSATRLNEVDMVGEEGTVCVGEDHKLDENGRQLTFRDKLMRDIEAKEKNERRWKIYDNLRWENGVIQVGVQENWPTITVSNKVKSMLSKQRLFDYQTYGKEYWQGIDSCPPGVSNMELQNVKPPAPSENMEADSGELDMQMGILSEDSWQILSISKKAFSSSSGNQNAETLITPPGGAMNQKTRKF
ncbi:hypothetical protein O6P43_026189 [Quillaja saponaria]|uniref:Uncharacterized protein n=1 Tax=Quillaja saponaria TaxID=32244 RepID=A0AAD7LAP9_QUISA|nr:hypothetical protein O6P43_026189 [Quillaja saponaria]